MSTTNVSRILAVDLRARRLGYAAFETPHRLLDMGISTFDTVAKARSRMQSILKIFRPTGLVLDAGAARGVQNKRRTASAIKMIRRQAQLDSIPVTVISTRVLQAHLAEHGVRNKYDFATLSASWFPQLSCRVPPKRKCYDSEPWIMVSFDAVALGTTYLSQHNHDSAQFFRRSLSDE